MQARLMTSSVSMMVPFGKSGRRRGPCGQSLLPCCGSWCVGEPAKGLRSSEAENPTKLELAGLHRVRRKVEQCCSILARATAVMSGAYQDHSPRWGKSSKGCVFRCHSEWNSRVYTGSDAKSNNADGFRLERPPSLQRPIKTIASVGESHRGSFISGNTRRFSATSRSGAIDQH